MNKAVAFEVIDVDHYISSVKTPLVHLRVISLRDDPCGFNEARAILVELSSALSSIKVL